jgi:hypothetical protein
VETIRVVLLLEKHKSVVSVPFTIQSLNAMGDEFQISCAAMIHARTTEHTDSGFLILDETHVLFCLQKYMASLKPSDENENNELSHYQIEEQWCLGNGRPNQNAKEVFAKRT